MLYLYSKISNLRSLSCWPITSQFTQLLANHDAAIKAHREHFDMMRILKLTEVAPAQIKDKNGRKGITCQGTNVSGHKHVWAQMCVGTNVCGHNRVWAQTCVGTNVCGHKRVWAQTCVGTNVCGHKRVWAQSCVGTIVSGHKRVWAQSCLGTIVSGHNRVWAKSCVGQIVSGHNRVWAQSCVGTIVCGHNRVWAQSCGLNHVWAQSWWNRVWYIQFSLLSPFIEKVTRTLIFVHDTNDMLCTILASYKSTSTI